MSEYRNPCFIKILKKNVCSFDLFIGWEAERVQ